MDFFEISLPKYILNSALGTDKMNYVLKLYSEIEANKYNKIMQKLVDQEIKTLSIWCEVPNSNEGKKMLIDNGTINSTAIEINDSFNIVKIYYTFYYGEVGSGSLSFSYDVKTEKIESLGASS